MKSKNIQRLLKSGVTERLWSAMTELRYIFSHALLRDTAYEMQARSRLRGLHKIAGDIMVRLYPEDKTRLADITNHYEQAEEWKEAGEYLLKAGDHAREIYDNQNSVDLYSRLIRLRESHPEAVDDQCEVEAMLRKASVLTLIGNCQDAIELYQGTLNRTETLNDNLLLCKTLNDIGRIYQLQGDYDKSMESLRKSLLLAEKSGDKHMISKVNINGRSIQKCKE